MSVIQHHIPLLQNRFFKHNMTKFKFMSLESLKETAKKWGVPIPPTSTKRELIDAISLFINSKHIKNYNRIRIKPLNGPGVWYESCYGYRCESFEGFETNRKGYYLLDKNSVEYNDIYKHKWSMRPLNSILGRVFTEPCRYILYFEELRSALIYLEKRNAFAAASLFEDILTKDIITYIRSFL